jgi:phosphonate metabolism protein PhnN/1,5-bisphosphokinase (PRPP-forming)
MSGLWVFVCGPSGAGKDSVMDWAAEHLIVRPDIVFARRMVTRPSRPGSDHDPVTPQQFARMLGSGALVWCWQAHGFHYGIGAHYAAEVAAGRVVVVNGSREHAGGLNAAEQVRVVQIMADARQLAARMTQRGRDAPQEVTRRLARNVQLPNLRADHTIVNEGKLADAGRQLADYLVAEVMSSESGHSPGIARRIEADPIL